MYIYIIFYILLHLINSQERRKSMFNHQHQQTTYYQSKNDNMYCNGINKGVSSEKSRNSLGYNIVINGYNSLFVSRICTALECGVGKRCDDDNDNNNNNNNNNNIYTHSSNNNNIISDNGPSDFLYNVGKYCYSGIKTSIDKDLFLNPYFVRRNRKEKTWIEINVLGSAFAAAFKQILMVYTICVIISAFLFADIIPSNIFPVDARIFTLILTLFSFLLGMFYSVSLNKNRIIFSQYINNIMNNVRDTSVNVQNVIKTEELSKCIKISKFNPQCGSSVLVNSTAWCLLLDINFILKSIPFAVKYMFRPGVGVEVYKLPMPKELADELCFLRNNGTDPLNGLRQMYTSRIGTLLNEGVLFGPSSGSLLSKSSVYGNSVSTISFQINNAQTPKSLQNLLLIALWIICIWFTFDFYPYWALVIHPVAYYFILLFAISFFQGVFYAIKKIGNPFGDPEKSNFTFYDVGYISRETAESIDGIFRVKRLYFLSKILNNIEKQIDLNESTL